MSYSVINHPFITHKLTILRNKETKHQLARALVNEITMLMVYEISRDLSLKEVEIETPMMKATGFEIDQRVAVVPILRAGLGMVDGITQLFPNAYVSHLGMYRDPHTFEPHVYYFKAPKEIAQMKVFLVDPLLATGGSIVAAIQQLRQVGVTDITVVSLIGVKQGIEKILAMDPQVKIFLGALDEKLNDHAYILPGMGDAGDRLFGTI
ncbi:MAG: uracil phosphoribosyltransferase [Candidatus Izemoplasmatales bacterium]|nr:uracil phosphoribosyltransferase [Candidatus Izemoplasmatales bacterium]